MTIEYVILVTYTIGMLSCLALVLHLLRNKRLILLDENNAPLSSDMVSLAVFPAVVAWPWTLLVVAIKVAVVHAKRRR